MIIAPTLKTRGRTSKEITRSLVFEALAQHRRISRPKLAEITGLSRATIAVICDELQSSGLVEQVGSGGSSGGRPPTILRFCESAAYAIGASLYDYNWLIVATDLAGRVFDRQTASMRDHSPEGCVETLAQGISRLRERHDTRRLLPAIGLGPPGLVDMQTGTIKSAVDLGWREFPIGPLIEQRTSLGTVVANRSKAGALAVLWHQSQRETSNLIYISLGTGVAAGIIQNGQLLVGSNSSAGELGHVTVVPDGPLCDCGNRGCLQQLVSEQAIANAARIALRRHSSGMLARACGAHPETLTAFDVLSAAEQGDPTAVTIVEQTADYLSIAVANLVNLFNPQMIVLGGPVAEASPLLVQNVIEYTPRRAMAYPLSAVHIDRNRLGPETGAIGAAVLILQHAQWLFFQLPVTV